MTKDEALKLALEALCKIIPCDDVCDCSGQRAIAAIKEALSSGATVAQPTSGDYALGYAEGFNDACKKPAQQEPFEYWNAVEGWVKIDELRDHMDSVGCGTIYKTAGEDRVPLCIAQPPVAKPHEQEPVSGCVCRWNSEGDRTVTCERHQGWLDVIAEWADRARNAEKKLKVQPQQEPVATLWQHGRTGRTRITMPGDITDCDANWFPAADLYTTPPPVATQHERPWIGLTIEDKKEYVAQDFGGSRFDAMDWAEKRLKEKNNV